MAVDRESKISLPEKTYFFSKLNAVSFSKSTSSIYKKIYIFARIYSSNLFREKIYISRI